MKVEVFLRRAGLPTLASASISTMSLFDFKDSDCCDVVIVVRIPPTFVSSSSMLLRLIIPLSESRDLLADWDIMAVIWRLNVSNSVAPNSISCPDPQTLTVASELSSVRRESSGSNHSECGDAEGAVR